jgi:FMN phosphatase YigB (HAD superfamily)
MGIEGCIRRRYGPDLINYPKVGARYYELLLADAGVDPSRSLVVDDKPQCLDWARAAGANVVLVAPRPVDGYVTVPRLADIPPLLESGLIR